MDRLAFVASQRQLLNAERRAEALAIAARWRECSDSDLLARGECLLRMGLADLLPGHLGKLVAVLRQNGSAELPEHRFGPGDLVALRRNRDEPVLATGVVARTTREALFVHLEDDTELTGALRVDRIASEVTWRRLESALDWLEQDHRGPTKRMLDVWFGERQAEFGRLDATLPWHHQGLDAGQQAAVQHALAAEHVALIHGPPGTGKTTTLVECIVQLVALGQRVLACAPSNVAVDNLAERLAVAGLRIVRMGHPARTANHVVPHTLAAQIDRAPEQSVLANLRKELDVTLRRMARTSSRDERATHRATLRALRQDRKTIEQAIARGVVDGAQVVLATLTGAADGLVRGSAFDCAVIDEASQALEAACWLPLQLAPRAILAGDPRQLPPTLHSEAASRAGLAVTLFERIASAQPHVVHMLTMQYRMHQTLMQYPSRAFYGEALQAHASVREHHLAQLPGVQPGAATTTVLRFIDTAGTDLRETAANNEFSRANPGEAALVVQIVLEWLEAGLSAEQIAVITPYNAQVQELRRQLGAHRELEIGSVDGLQGREKEAIVLSLVRSNEAGEVGFLADARRLNVAITRARRQLCVIGDSSTLANEQGLLPWVEFLQQHGDYRSAYEFGAGDW